MSLKRRIVISVGTATFAALVLVAVADIHWTVHWHVSPRLHLAIGAGSFIIDVDLDGRFRRAGELRMRTPYASPGEAFDAWFRDYWMPTWNSFDHQHLIYVPLWIPLLLVAVPTWVAWRGGRRHRMPGCCPRCGYNLTGNVTGHCPECGAACESAIKPAAPEQL